MEQYTGTITAKITEQAIEFNSKVEGMALSKWGYNKSDIEKALKELQAYRDIGLTPEEINDHEEMFKSYRHVCGGRSPEEIEKALGLLEAQKKNLLIALTREEKQALIDLLGTMNWYEGQAILCRLSGKEECRTEYLKLLQRMYYKLLTGPEYEKETVYDKTKDQV